MQYPGPELPKNPNRRERAEHKRAFDKWLAEETARIRLQRALFEAIPEAIREPLQTAMLDRAWALLESAECEAADALLELVPEDVATSLLNEFFGED